MQAVWHLACKDLLILSRDKMGLFFILGFPVLMGLFFGNIMGGPSSDGPQSKLRLAIVDEDASDISKAFIANLESNGSVELVPHDRGEAMELVRKGNIVGMIALPQGFGETAGIPWEASPVIQLGMDPSRTAESAMVQGFIMQGMGQLFGDRLFQPEQMRAWMDDLRETLTSAESEVPLAAGL